MNTKGVEDGTDWRASDDAHMDAQGGMGSVASASVESSQCDSRNIADEQCHRPSGHEGLHKTWKLGGGSDWLPAPVESPEELPHEGQWIVSAKVIHPDYLKQIEHELWQIGGAFAEIKVENKPAVPVEERTAMPSGIKPETAVRLIDQLNEWLITQRSYELRIGETPVECAIRLLSKPISEERTAEEQLMGLLREYQDHFDIHDGCIHCAKLWDKADALLDHIEGKGE